MVNFGKCRQIYLPYLHVYPFLSHPIQIIHVPCDVGVSKNSGTPKSSILIGFSIIFTIHFGVPWFLETPMWPVVFVVVCFFCYSRSSLINSLKEFSKHRVEARFLGGQPIPTVPPARDEDEDFSSFSRLSVGICFFVSRRVRWFVWKSLQCMDLYFEKDPQGGPLLVINGVITLINGLING